jgi:hypothetical protein
MKDKAYQKRLEERRKQILTGALPRPSVAAGRWWMKQMRKADNGKPA